MANDQDVILDTSSGFQAGVTALQTNQRLYGRKISLLVGDAQGNGLDLSQLEIQFSVTSACKQTPRKLEFRLYNVAPGTQARLKSEFLQVALSAGYTNGPFGLIFGGLITQVHVGREDACDSFVDVVAVDGDYAYNFSVVNVTLKAGSTAKDERDALIASLKANASEQDMPKGSYKLGYCADLPSQQTIRAKTLYGCTTDHLRRFAANIGAQWRLEGGSIDFIPKLGIIPGDAVVLSSKTGMIGIPQLTPDGVVVTCLLNPNIRTGRALKIDNTSISQTTLKAPINIEDPFYLPGTDPDSLYKVYSVKHYGDIREQAFYTEAICTAYDGTNPPNTQGFLDAIVNGI